MGEGSPSSRASHARSGSCPPPTAARSSGPCSTPPGHAHQPAQGVLSLPPRSRPYSPTPAAWPDCFSVPAPAPTQPDTPSPQQGAETKRPPGEGHGSRQPKATSRSAAASRRGLEPTVSNRATRCLPCSTRSAQVLASTRPPTWTSLWVDVSHVPHRADVWSPRPVGGMGCPVGLSLESAQKSNPATPRPSVNMGDSLVAGSERLGPVDGRGRGASSTVQTTLSLIH